MSGLNVGMGVVLGLILIAAGGLALTGGEQRAEKSASAQAEKTDPTIVFWLMRAEGDPTDYVAHSKLGEAYASYARESGDTTAYGPAEAALRSALALRPADQAARAALAGVLLATHQFADARRAFRHDEAHDVFGAEPGAGLQGVPHMRLDGVPLVHHRRDAALGVVRVREHRLLLSDHVHRAELSQLQGGREPGDAGADD